MSRRCIAVSVILLAAAPALAERNLTLGITGGSLGIGPQVDYRINKALGLHADATFLGVGHGFNSHDLHYEGHAHLQSAGTAIDIYPFGGDFRFSLGGRQNGNRAEVSAMPATDTRIGGQVFTPQEIGTLTGTGKVRAVAPTLTIGYSGRLKRGFMFGVDGGAMFQGLIKLSKFMASNEQVPQTRLDQEQADLQHDLQKFKIYPILQFNVGYRF